MCTFEMSLGGRLPILSFQALTGKSSNHFCVSCYFDPVSLFIVNLLLFVSVAFLVVFILFIRDVYMEKKTK